MNYTKFIGVVITTIGCVSLTSCGLFGSSVSSTKQSEVIKQDFSGSKVTWSDDSISYGKIKIYDVSCIGNKQEQSVTYTFSIKNLMSNKKISIDPEEAYDALGNSYKGGRQFRFILPKDDLGPFGCITNVFLPTDQSVKFAVTVFNVLPSTEIITTLRLRYHVDTPEYTRYSQGEWIFKNLPIYWK